MATKTTDKKGRLLLGHRFANKTFIVEQIDETELRLTEAAIIPKRELWLRTNQLARAAIRRGIAQAKRGEFATPPDLQADACAPDDGDE